MRITAKIPSPIAVSVLVLITVLALVSPRPAAAIEELSDSDLEKVTGQAGVSIFMTTTLITRQESTFIIYDTLGGSLEYTPLTSTLSIATTDKTIDLDLRNIDHPEYDYTAINFAMDDMNISFNSVTGDFIFNGVSLGRFETTNFQIPTVDLSVFAQGEVGIKGGLTTTFSLERYAWTYDNESSLDATEKLVIGNLSAAEYYSGEPLPSYEDTVSPGTPINIASWQREGYLKIGDAFPAPTETLNAFSLDFREDDSLYIRREFQIDWQGNYLIDPDGYLGDGSVEKPYITNPRYDGAVYIDIGIPIEGSIRIESVAQEIGASTVDYGPVAIDGIRGYTRIEAPGYGIGNSPTTSTLYE